MFEKSSFDPNHMTKQLKPWRRVVIVRCDVTKRMGSREFEKMLQSPPVTIDDPTADQLRSSTLAPAFPQKHSEPQVSSSST